MQHIMLIVLATMRRWFWGGTLISLFGRADAQERRWREVLTGLKNGNR